MYKQFFLKLKLYMKLYERVILDNVLLVFKESKLRFDKIDVGEIYAIH